MNPNKSYYQKKSYNFYLSSKTWKDKRDRIIKKRKVCKSCHDNKDLELHHLSYKNIFDEPDGDLMLLCKTCHNQVHEYHKQNKNKSLRQNTLNFIKFISKSKSKPKNIKTPFDEKIHRKFLKLKKRDKEKASKEKSTYKVKVKPSALTKKKEQALKSLRRQEFLQFANDPSKRPIYVTKEVIENGQVKLVKKVKSVEDE